MYFYFLLIEFDTNWNELLLYYIYVFFLFFVIKVYLSHIGDSI